MARFDVYHYGKYDVEFMLDVQSHMLPKLATKVCIPLVRSSDFPGESFPRLKPELIISRKKYILMTPDMVSTDRRDLGEIVTNLEKYHREIIDSIDFLLQGF